MTDYEIKFPGRATWEKMLYRWSDFPACGEKRLICAVIAQAIVDETNGKYFDCVAEKNKFFGDRLDRFCYAISLDSNFVREQILSTAAKVGTTVRF